MPKRFQEANKSKIENLAAKTGFTTLKVKQIKELGFHRDHGQRGLYLQVALGKNGAAKSWVYRFVSPVTGKSRWMGLGPADAITLAKARELAKAARETVKLRSDPIENRREEILIKKLEAAKSVTFGQCASDYIAEHSNGWKNDKHVAQWRSTFEGKNAATSLINSLPVSKIDTNLVLKVLRPIWKETPETASRIRGRIERVLAWAAVSEYRKGENPARWRGHLSEMLPAKSKIHRVEHHKAIPYPELPAFMQRLRTFDSVSARALETTILCATRTIETIGARWSEIDLKEKVWTVPATRMKSKRPHRVPLPDRVLKILKSLPREDDLVFPGGKKGQALSNMAMLECLRGMTDDSGYTVHGFRSSFRDWAKERTSFPREIAELALAHVVADKSEAAYSRGDALDKRRRLMDAWSAYCATAPQETATVTPIRAERLMNDLPKWKSEFAIALAREGDWSTFSELMGPNDPKIDPVLQAYLKDIIDGKEKFKWKKHTYNVKKRAHERERRVVAVVDFEMKGRGKKRDKVLRANLIKKYCKIFGTNVNAVDAYCQLPRHRRFPHYSETPLFRVVRKP